MSSRPVKLEVEIEPPNDGIMWHVRVGLASGRFDGSGEAEGISVGDAFQEALTVALARSSGGEGVVTQ